MMPSTAPRPLPRLSVMRATARIMCLKRAMVLFDHVVGVRVQLAAVLQLTGEQGERVRIEHSTGRPAFGR